MSRCTWAIQYGTTLATRCYKELGHVFDPNNGTHVGKGLIEFPYQEIRWFDGDRRQFLTEREDEYSWEALKVEGMDEFNGPEV